jgi:hypothetical protein
MADYTRLLAEAGANQEVINLRTVLQDFIDPAWVSLN